MDKPVQYMIKFLANDGWKCYCYYDEVSAFEDFEKYKARKRNCLYLKMYRLEEIK